MSVESDGQTCKWWAEKSLSGRYFRAFFFRFFPVFAFAFGPLFPLLPGPSFFGGLAAAAQSQRVSRNGIGDGGSSGHVSAFANPHWRHQSGITADEGAFFNDGYVLIYAIVVAGDGSCADVDSRANLGVAKIGEMVGFGAASEPGFFCFDKIAHVRALTNFTSRTNVRVRPELRSGGNA